MQYLHISFCFFLFFCGYFVAFSTNPINSVIFLILTFCNAACILFLFNTEFLGLVFVIIYVGAIAVLFLFVIMMLNVKIDSVIFLKNKFDFLYYFKVLLAYFFILFIFLAVKNISLTNNFYSEVSLFSAVDTLYNIEILGQTVYNYFLVCFLLAGLVLLIALVGSIVLTLRFNILEKSQLVHRQLSRTDNFLTFFR